MNASIPQPEPNLTPDEIVDRARAMVPVLRERSVKPNSYARSRSKPFRIVSMPVFIAFSSRGALAGTSSGCAHFAM